MSSTATIPHPVRPTVACSSWRITSKRTIFFLLILVVLLVSGWPLANLIKLGLRGADLSLFDVGLVKVLTNTLVIAILSTSFSIILGTVFGFLLSRTNIFGKNQIKSFLLYPYIIPSVILAIGWVILANPGVGLLKPFFPWINIYTISGIFFVEVLSWYTFVMLNVGNVLENMDGSLEESARMCGASPLRIFFTITLPLLRPALIGSSILVFLCSLSSFAVPAIIGGPGKIYVLTTKIYQWIKIGTTNSVLEAMMLSIPIIVVAFVLGYASEKWLNRHSFATLTGKHNRKLEIRLGRWRWPLTVAFIAYYQGKTRYRSRNLLVTLASLPYAAPGTILAMAILFNFTGYSPYFLLLFAYVAKYMNYGIRVVSPAISNVDKSLEEASLMCGATWLQTIVKVWLPVLKGTFSTAIFLLIAPLFSECTMSLMLSGPEAPTIGIRLFHLQEYESPPLASVLAVVILVLVIGLNLTVKKLSRGKLGV